MKKVIKNIVIAVLAVLLVLVMVHSCVADNMNMHVEETGTGVKLVVTYNQKQYEVALTPVQNTAAPSTNTGAAAQSTVPQTNTAPQATQPAAGTAVTLEQAKTIALNDAGVTQAQFIKTKQDFDDGRQVYEIDFIANNREYEYDIDCATGRIIKADTDLYFSLQGNSSTAQNNTAAGTVITSAEAENIALKDAGVTKANVTYIHSHNDSDDGIVVYDVEFVANSTKYEYSIRRDNGAIVDKDVERR